MFRQAGPPLLMLVSATLLAASPATAQRWQVDLTGTQVEFDTTAAQAAASVAPLAEWSGRGAYLLLGGSLTAFEAAQWAGQGWGNFSLLSDPIAGSPLRGELLGVASGTLHSSNFRTAATRGEIRLHVAGRQAGLWLGGAGATGWTSASPDIATAFGPTAGVWARHSTSSASLVFSPFRLEGFWFPELNGRASISVGPLDMLAYGGWRGATGESGISSTTWGGAEASVWLTRGVALVVGGGSYAPDLLQALPSGRYISAAIRISARRPPVVNVKAQAPRTYDPKGDEGSLLFRLPGAQSVEVVGDWTDWQPVPMRRARDGRWTLDLTLPPGVHRFNLIVDGERWIVPDGVPSVDDGFGGETGLLIVTQ